MRCDQCGSPNPDANNFCGTCGKRMVFVPMPSFAHAESTARVNTGKALSNLGVRDIHDERSEEPDLPLTTDEIEPPVPSVSDPIKPASYLADITLPEPPAGREPEPDIHHYVSELRRAVEQRAVLDSPPRNEPTTISGPSFLGLATGSDSDDSSYLLEDDQPRRRGGWILFALIMIAVFVGIGYMEWNTIKTGKINIPFLKNTSDQPSSSSATPQPATPDSTTPPSTKPANPTNPDASATAQQPSQDKPADKPLVTDENKPADTKPADDSAATQSALNRQAQESQEKKAEESSQSKAVAAGENTADGSEEENPPVKKNSAEAKRIPKPRAQEVVETRPNPRANPMLIRGENYLYGRGVPRNCQQAMIYFRAAAEDNNSPAMSHLAAMYNTGECVKQDRVSAYSWLRRAHDSDPANQWIAKNMNMIWRDMSPQERASVRR